MTNGKAFVNQVHLAKRDWKLPQISRSKVIDLARQLEIPPIVAQVLAARGIFSSDIARRFLHPALEHIADPFLLTDMDKAVQRVSEAVKKQEKILIFGDYDVDGVTATVLLYRAIKRMGGENCFYDVPHRTLDGFGLNSARVQQAYQEGFSLIITVDNGSSAYEAADHACRLGIDLIITDHHQPTGAIPPATAVVNSARETPDHASFHACGVAIACKLAWALTNEVHDLDLVALGTIADVVPLLGENRDFAAVGLEWISRQRRPGIQALLQLAGLRADRLRSEDVAFHLAPRINAAGRLSSAHTALDLLLTDSEDDALRLAQSLENANEERKRLELLTLEDAQRILDRELKPDSKAIVLGSRQWHPGVVGIVAARLQSQYGLPTILVVFGEDGIGRGSARSVEGMNVAEILSECQEHLIAYGGHKAAAGVTIHCDCFDKFRTRFENAVSRRFPEGPVKAPLAIDAVVSLTELDGRLLKSLEKLAPFGHGNPAPTFISQQVRVLPNSVRDVKGEHVRFAVQEGPRVLPAIGFRMLHRLGELESANTVDIVYTPQLEYWQGDPTIQLRIRDFRVVSNR